MHVGEIADAAVLTVPAALPHVVEHGETELLQLRVIGATRLTEHEPRGLDGMSGIEESAVEMVVDFAGRADDLHHRAQVMLHEVPGDLVDGLAGPLAERASEHRHVTEVGAKVLRRHQGHHQRRESLRRAGRRGDLRGDATRFPLVAEESLVGGEGALLPLGLPGRSMHGAVTDRGEAFAEDVAAHAQRVAFGGDGEMQLAGEVRTAVVEEVGARQRRLEPLRTRLDGIVEVGEGPSRAALEPDGLVGVEQFAFSAEGGMDAAMLTVEAVLQPERDDVLQEPVPIGTDELGPSLLKIRGHGDDAGTRAGRVNARPPAARRKAR